MKIDIGKYYVYVVTYFTLETYCSFKEPVITLKVSNLQCSYVCQVFVNMLVNTFVNMFVNECIEICPPEFYEYYEDTWIGNDNELAHRWGNAFLCSRITFHGSALSTECMEIIKAHDTNAISEGRNSADRKLFEGIW